MKILLIVGVSLCAVFVASAQQRWLVDSTRTRKDTLVLPTVDVLDTHVSPFLISRVNDIEAGAIYAAKKTERIKLENVIANTATNNTRQTMSGVAGLNIWESDGAGLQLGIGGRGLNPNRTSNFTTRQNGYDISADPLGYPESYYVPPMAALERIDIVRGAGALRYGTQFGGVVNFVFKEGARTAPLAADASLSAGSFGFAGAFARLGGTVDGTNYVALYQFRRADGWRPNSDFHQHLAYAAVTTNITSQVRVRADYTFMTYLAHQPGGLTDRMFETDPSQSVRARNWFNVNWNLASITLDWFISARTSLRSVLFGNLSSRQALGNLDRINTVDLGGPRTMIDGTFQSIGNETTIQHDLVLGDAPWSLLAGVRVYRGTTTQQQGDASDGSGPDFSFSNPSRLEGSDYRFPNDNAALFAEALISVTPEFRLVPGMRVEHITTRADGYYALRVKDLAGNLVVDSLVYEEQERSRTIQLVGLGASYMIGPIEIYANATQNYRSITFSDLRINNPNLKIDPNIADERGYTLDLGVRGQVSDMISWDASAFYLRYNDKIGEVLRSDEEPLYLPYRYRTNIADAYTAGIEAVTDIDLTAMFWRGFGLPAIHWIINGTVLQGEYLSSDDPSIDGNAVEYVPSYVLRTGLNVKEGGFRISLLLSFIGKQFSDASNAEYTASAVSGSIPAYSVADITVGYTFGAISVDASCNNVLGSSYFTRRADSYPGPGIIPAEPRSFFVTVKADM